MKPTMTALTLAALVLGGCVKQQVVGGGSAVGPSLVLEQFMRAVNSEPKDVGTMGRLFGNKEGPVSARFPKAEVEPRMFLLATVLRHDDYQIVSETEVPGRLEEARNMMVRIKSGQLDNRVPFTFVRYKDGWLIEQIDIGVITRPR